MSVYLFTGIETFSWSLQDFQKVIDFCKAHAIDGIILKIYEITQGEWYQHIGLITLINFIKFHGLDVLPYGFYYGASPAELESIHKYLALFGKYCINLEGAWDNNIFMAKTLADNFSQHSGELWISTWANPVDHGWIENIKLLDSDTQVWMPEEYGDANIQRRLDQFPTVQGNIFPTYSVGTSINLMAVSNNPSIWEYQDAEKNPQWVDDFVAHMKGSKPVSSKVILNSVGCVCDVVRSNQLFEGEMELCGPWSIYSIIHAGFPGQGSKETVEEIDQAVDTEVARMGYPNPKDFPGVSIPDMERIFHDAGLHYWEIHSDVATISKAVRAGYPVIITANEANIRRWDGTTWAMPYDWQILANHVFPVAGLDNNGNFICYDQLSSRNPWPVIYNASLIKPTYAAVVQLSFLQTIPSGDPNNWPVGFNAQQKVSVPPMTDYVLQAAIDEWNSGILVLPFDTGIAQAWLADFRQGKFHGPPLDGEHALKNWSGQSIIVQRFSGSRCEWTDGNARWFSYS
jgi:hypothetical protein